MRLHATPVRGLAGAVRSPIFQGRFGRIFRGLPAASFGADEAANVKNLHDLADAIAQGDDEAKDGLDAEESGIPSLYTYLGQFIDHDLTFDPASSLQKQNDPNALTDFRSPAFDLDCVYGRGPDDQPYMYERDTPGRFLLGDPISGGGPAGVDARDLPRASNGRALIGDPRNDENTIVSQLQGLFLKFHNRLFNESGEPFERVQQLVRFHYQYVILNDFLPRIIHADVLNALKTNGKFDRSKLEFYHWRNDPFMPVEFAAAAYRFGHSMVRPGYRINDNHLLVIFPDLVGFEAIKPDRAMDWGRFIDIDTRSHFDAVNRLQLAYRIDTSLVDPLAHLPPQVAVNPASLPERNLLRGWRLGLPSGQDVARAMGVIPIPDEEILIGKAEDEPEEPLKNILEVSELFADNCPLWTYVLAEAMRFRVQVPIPLKEPGTLVTTPQLGPVGGRIVAETFVGLMFGDEKSYLNLDRNWTPKDNPNYKLKDFVNFALGL